MSVESLAKQITEDMLMFYAATQVPNYEELEKEAARLAVEEYEETRNIPKYSEVYEYLAKEHSFTEERLIEVLASAQLLKVALENNYEHLIAWQRKDLISFRKWFDCKTVKSIKARLWLDSKIENKEFEA